MQPLDSTSRLVTAAASEALRGLPGAPAKLGDLQVADFPSLLAATTATLKRIGQPLSEATVRQLLANVIAGFSSDRGLTAQSLLATTASITVAPRVSANALLNFHQERREGDEQTRTVQLLKTSLQGNGPRPVARQVQAWATALGHRMSPRTKSLLALAEKEEIQIQAASIPSGLAHFDRASNAVKLDIDRLDRFLTSEKKPLTAERLIERVVAHELIHGVITARVPNFDYANMRPVPRPEFDEGLKTILGRLEAEKASPEVQRVLGVIRNSDPANLPEEVVTYTLTMPELEDFVRRQGQLAPLKALLKRHGLGALVGEPG